MCGCFLLSCLQVHQSFRTHQCNAERTTRPLTVDPDINHSYITHVLIFIVGVTSVSCGQLVPNHRGQLAVIVVVAAEIGARPGHLDDVVGRRVAGGPGDRRYTTTRSRAPVWIGLTATRTALTTAHSDAKLTVLSREPLSLLRHDYDMITRQILHVSK